MAINLRGIITNWREARTAGTQIANLAHRAQVAYTAADGTDKPPHADTIADIKAQAAVLVPEFESAILAMKNAYTP